MEFLRIRKKSCGRLCLIVMEYTFHVATHLQSDGGLLETYIFHHHEEGKALNCKQQVSFVEGIQCIQTNTICQWLDYQYNVVPM